MKTKNGKTVTDAMLDAWADAFESGEWPEERTIIEQGAVEETIHLTSIPGMAESLQAGMVEPIENCLDESQVW